MSRHRAEPPRRRAPAPGRRRAQARPRYGRVGVLAVSSAVCLVALLGGTGVLPSVADDGGASVAKDPTGRSDEGTSIDTAALAMDSTKDEAPADSGKKKPQRDEPSSDGAAGDDAGGPGGSPESDRPDTDVSADESLPADSGDGKRVVFSQARQRVWLVDEDETVARTYPVSGSLYDNLDPGDYSVYSRSEQAYAFDGSGSMKYFVRFTQGDSGSAIGFHDIPIDNNGDLVQTLDQLGTPQSHGCVRQERDDAIALWEFAPIGTEVVVV